jgi:hypothetical protein
VEESGKGLSRPLNSWGWGNSHVAMDVVIMYSESLVGGESCAREYLPLQTQFASSV